MARVKIQSTLQQAPSIGVKWAGLPSPSQAAAQASAGDSDVQSGLNTLVNSLQWTSSELEKKEIAANKQQLVVQQGVEQANLYKTTADFIERARAERPEGMNDNQFNANIMLQAYKELGSGKYASMTPAAVNNFLSQTRDMLTSTGSTTVSASESGLATTVNTSDGSVKFHQNEEQLYRSLFKKSLDLAPAASAAMMQQVSELPTGQRENIMRNWVQHQADIETTKATLSIENEKLKLSKQRREFYQPVMVNKLITNTVSPIINSSTAMLADVAKSWKGSPESLKEYAKSFLHGQLLNSSSIAEGLNNAGKNYTEFETSLGGILDSQAEYISSLAPASRMKDKANYLKSDLEIKQYQLINNLTDEQFNSLELGKHFGQNAVIGSILMRDQMNIDPSRGVADIMTGSLVEDNLFEQARKSDDDLKVVVNKIATGFKSILTGSPSNLKVSSISLWNRVKADKQLMEKINPTVAEKLDALYKRATGNNYVDIERILNE